MKTVCVGIGNSDNKLTQADWERFVAKVNSVLSVNTKVHFFGGPPNYSQYQNVSWVVDVQDSYIPSLKSVLDSIKHEFRQDTVAWLEGTTEFI